MTRPLPPKQHAALLGLYGGTLDGTPADPGEPGIKAATWRALKKKAWTKANPKNEEWLVITRLGRSALGLRRRNDKTTVGALRAAVRIMVPWDMPSGSVLVGSRLPSLYADSDEVDGDTRSLSGHPDLLAAIPESYPATLEPEAIGLDDDALFDASTWADLVGLDEDEASMLVWQAVAQWMDEMGHPVEISEEQGFQLVYRED